MRENVFLVRKPRGSPAALGHARDSRGSSKSISGTRLNMVQTAKDSGDGLLRVGVVGVGIMGSNHARVLADLPGVRLAGIADPDLRQREFVAGALGCAGHADVDGLLAEGVHA